MRGIWDFSIIRSHRKFCIRLYILFLVVCLVHGLGEFNTFRISRLLNMGANKLDCVM